MGERDIAWAGVTVDCRDTELVAGFWAEVSGVTARAAGEDRPGWFRIGPVVPGGPVVNFQPVPEAKAGKARIHLDLWVDDLAAAVARVEQLGGRRIAADQVLERGRIAVMADPEGNQPRVRVSALADAAKGGRAGSGGGLCLLAAPDP